MTKMLWLVVDDLTNRKYEKLNINLQPNHEIIITDPQSVSNDCFTKIPCEVINDII